MTKLSKARSKHRTVLTELDDLPHAGVYVIAYMGRVVYVGKASLSVSERLVSHITQVSAVGAWMRRIQDDWGNVRLDVLEAPDSGDAWINKVEEALIKKFRPVFNDALL